MKNLNYRVGSIIQYRSFGELRTVEVEEKSDDIKHGQPGFDGKILNDTTGFPHIWGYDDQIVAVTKF